MARINRLSVIQELVKGLMLEQSRDKIPTDLADKIVPVYQVNEVHFSDIFAGNTFTSTETSTVIHTAHAKRFTFLTGVLINNQSDVTCDNVGILISVLINGKRTTLARLSKLTLTVYQDGLYLLFVNPIKIDRGSEIHFTNTFSLGASTSFVSVEGYEVDEE